MPSVAEIKAELAAKDSRYIPHRDGTHVPNPGVRIAGAPPGGRTIPANPPNPAATAALSGAVGPGTHLKIMLDSVGLNAGTLKGAGTCGCDDLAAQMDAWGPNGCREHRAEIVAKLRENKDKTPWAVYLGAMMKMATTGLAVRINPMDQLGSLVDEAVRRAEEDGAWRTPGGATAGPPVRHLAYYVWPVKGNGIWQLNLDRLLLRAGLFNGRKLVAVATSANADEPHAVRDYLGGEFEVFGIPNSPFLRETVAWEPLWDRLADRTGAGDATFFAHAKGVTKDVNPGVTVHEWAAVMYETNLDYWPVVASVLARNPIAGSLKKYGEGFGTPRSLWHYSGSFYWVRNQDFFARDWRGLVDRTWWGTEAYPGVAYEQSEGGIIFGRGSVPALNLYVWDTWDRLRPDLAEWRRANTGNRTTFPSPTGR